MDKNNKHALIGQSIGTASANFLESELGCTSTLRSQKPCRHNNKFDYSKTIAYNIPKDAINDVCFSKKNIALVMCCFFSIQYRDGGILLKKHKLHLYIVIFY